MLRTTVFVLVALVIALMNQSADARELRLFRDPPQDEATKSLLDTFSSHLALADAGLTVRQEDMPTDVRSIVVDEGVRLLLVSLDRLLASGLVQNSPAISALLQPGQFPSTRALFDVQDGPVGEAALAEVGRQELLIPIAHWSRAQTAVVTTGTIASANDFRARDIRTPLTSQVADEGIRTFGGRPIRRTFTETAIALERGEFDAAELNADGAHTLLEQMRPARPTLAPQYRANLGFLLAEKNGWERLAERERAAIAEAAANANDAARLLAIGLEEKLESAARSNGVHIVRLAITDAAAIVSVNDARLSAQFRDSAPVGLQIVRQDLAASRLGTPTPPAPARAPVLAVKPPVLFVTDRLDEGGDNPKVRFASTQVDGEPTLTCGQADYQSAPNRQVGEDYNGPISLVPSPLPTGTNACIDLIIKALRENNKSRVLLFIHGYNNTFHFAVGRAIASATDVGFDGLVLVWSWPSEGNARAYMRDEAAARRTWRHVPPFVQTLVAHPEVQRLDIVAHSMGNRIALALIDELRRARTPVNIGSIVFAAADEERGIFRDVIRDVGRETPNLGGIITVYAARYDQPLLLSAQLHSDKRVGLGGPDIMVLEGVESVDATDVEGGFLGALQKSSHAHVFDVPKAIDDLKNLLIAGSRAATRGLLKGQTTDVPPRDYWTIPR